MKYSLFCVANTVVAVGSESKVRVRLFCKISVHIFHSRFFRRAVDCTNGVSALNTAFLERTQTVEVYKSGSLVVGNSPAKESAVFVSKRIWQNAPVVAGRHNVKMRQHCAERAAVSKLNVCAFVGDLFRCKSEVVCSFENELKRLVTLVVFFAAYGFKAEKCVKVV